MDKRDDRHWWNPLTPQVYSETVERIGHQCTDDHQGQSMTAHQQAGYRRAIQSTWFVTSTTLAPPGKSLIKFDEQDR